MLRERIVIMPIAVPNIVFQDVDLIDDEVLEAVPLLFEDQPTRVAGRFLDAITGIDSEEDDDDDDDDGEGGERLVWCFFLIC